MNEISKESMKLKLEFLFRVLDETNKVFNGENDMLREKGENIISNLFMIGGRVIHMTRLDNQTAIEGDTSLYAKFMELLVERFNKLMLEVHKVRYSGLPITLTFGQAELTIVSGIENLIEDIAAIYEGATSPTAAQNDPFQEDESDLPEKYKEYLIKIANHDDEYFNNQDEQEIFMCDECLQKFPMSCADDLYSGTCTTCAAKLLNF